MWIIVNVIGSGKLKYLGDRTHCQKSQNHSQSLDNPNLSKNYSLREDLVVENDTRREENVDE